jgi:DNA modification methylase
MAGLLGIILKVWDERRDSLHGTRTYYILQNQKGTRSISRIFGFRARIVQASSNENDVVLDPFVGSGTTCKVARDLKRHWIGIDINPEYIKMSEERIANGTPLFDSVDPRAARKPIY